MGKTLTTVQENSQPLAVTDRKLEKPKMYRVVLLNDDFTPMEFVVEILMEFFAMDKTRAIDVMLTVHNAGKGLCGIFTKDIAETKVAQVQQYAGSHEYPLLCTMEME